MAIGPEVQVPLVGRVALAAGYNETDGKYHLLKVDDSGNLLVKDPDTPQHGYGTASAAVDANATANITVTLSGNLTGAPDEVVATIQLAAGLNPANFHWYVVSYTQTQVVVRVRNDSASQRTFTVHVIALRAV